MTIFHYVEYRNLLGSGNNPIRIRLDSAPTTIITGKNGSGKSTVREAITFALFGKPHRNITKAQLVNSINRKGCLVELGFSVHDKLYKIVRGIKPNVFEIYEDGNLINQDAHSRDYQKHLETNILKFNFKAFHQVGILGSGNFIPFMQLPAAARREVIEDLLDVGVFGRMNLLLKEDVAKLKNKISELSLNVQHKKDDIARQKRHIAELNAFNQQQGHEYQKEIDAIAGEMESLAARRVEYQTEYDAHIEQVRSDIASLEAKHAEFRDSRAQVRERIRACVSQAKFFEQGGQCPTCQQEITDDFRKQKLSELKESAHGLQEGDDFAVSQLTDIEEALAKHKERNRELQEINTKIREIDRLISGHQSQVNTLQAKLNDNRGMVDLEGANATLHGLIDEHTRMSEDLARMNDEQQYNRAIGEILKDTGIKTKVIRQYLPVMNRLINQYLETLELFALFTLDETFTESIKSRHYDCFSYDSFSQGEQQKINMALLFAWREVARMKNSVATNLLILDETFDSSLDGEGTNNLLKIIRSLPDETNTYIISHKHDVVAGGFARQLEFRKVKNFSQLVENA